MSELAKSLRAHHAHVTKNVMEQLHETSTNKLIVEFDTAVSTTYI